MDGDVPHLYVNGSISPCATSGGIGTRVITCGHNSISEAAIRSWANRMAWNLKLLMKGVPDWLVYEIDPDDGERFRQALKCRKRELSPFFFFTAKDDQHVIISTQDIQVVKPRVPTFEIYFRGQPSPYSDVLGEPGDLHSITISEEIDLEEEPFLALVDGDGEEIVFSPAQVVLLSYSGEDRLNETTLYRAAGLFPFENLSGTWGVHVWQRSADDRWYGHVDFIEDEESAEHYYEFDILGPFATKAGAAEATMRV